MTDGPGYLRPGYVRPGLAHIPPSDPAPAFASDTVQLSLNEGLDGPFPSALAAITARVPDLNRDPGRGSYELVDVLAARHAVPAAQVIVAAGADALIGYVSQAALDPGDEAVVAWPSFPSFVRDPQKRDARVITVPLRQGSIDLDAMAAAITPRTRLLFVATPNNPTGRVVPREDLTAFVRALPDHVLAVVDEAYFDYLDPSDRIDAIGELVAQGEDVLALRTFSKLYGLAGLRIGYGVGPEPLVAAMRKVQRGYDVSAVAQVAALASLADRDEVERRRTANLDPLAALTSLLLERGLEPLGDSAANFVLVDIGRDADAAAAALLRLGVSVQSGAPFGAPTSLRISAAPAADLVRLGEALREAGLGGY